jgi:hypothetical protein
MAASRACVFKGASTCAIKWPISVYAKEERLWSLATGRSEAAIVMIGDKACDSDPLDEELATAGIEMIAPHRGARKKPATQDGRPLLNCREFYKRLGGCAT